MLYIYIYAYITLQVMLTGLQLHIMILRVGRCFQRFRK